MSTLKKIFDYKSLDWLTIGLYLSLLFIGWTMIFASEFNPDQFKGVFSLENNYGKQLIWIITGIIFVVSIQFIDGKFLQNFAFVILGVVVLLLIAVLFTKPINGTNAWFDIGGFRFQPSEFGKTATALALASLLSMPEVKMSTAIGRTQAFLVLGVPTLLVLIQNDTGSTLVYLSLFLVLFRAGLNSTIFIITLVTILLSILALKFDNLSSILLLFIVISNFILLRFLRKGENLSLAFGLLAIIGWFLSGYIPFFYLFSISIILFIILSIINILKRNWQITVFIIGIVSIAYFYMTSVNYLVNNILKPHQQERIWVWLRPEKCDPLGSLYNLEQSKYAIGSGGFSGKGFLDGERTKLDYVPEQSTDFIFCTVGEEWGFIGSIILIGIFIVLISRILQIAERQRISFSKYYAYGVASIILFHFFVNIGMTMGLVPVIGIPLPFISYGGSSMMSFSIMLGILIKLDSERASTMR
jgi:rod shape determining protein RodA